MACLLAGWLTDLFYPPLPFPRGKVMGGRGGTDNNYYSSTYWSCVDLPSPPPRQNKKLPIPVQVPYRYRLWYRVILLVIFLSYLEHFCLCLFFFFFFSLFSLRKNIQVYPPLLGSIGRFEGAFSHKHNSFGLFNFFFLFPPRLMVDGWWWW